MRRLASGVPGLDEVLGGGIPEGSSVVIAGTPGTGKTVLAQHMLFASQGQGKVLYLATMSEPQFKVLRYQQRFAFFDQGRIMASVVFEDVAASMHKGPQSVVRAVEQAQSHGMSHGWW
ncbi:MAG: RAD55 family ATPase [Bacillota bacterium]|nr:RAD55 family ATPase [Bacillota bacterium]